ncbi:MAG: tetratricopeptide repeat protein [Candidatus Sumerlaeia bacterium]|nr:tetratricopeptide repeat protein [Candidatus Sumerlaeia bacterium]
MGAISCNTPAERAYKRGKAAERREDYSGALAAYKTALELDSKFMRAYDKIANIYMEQKKYDEAEKILKKAIEIDADYYKAYRRLSKLYRLKGELDKARAICEQGLARPGVKDNEEEYQKFQSELQLIEKSGGKEATAKNEKDD